MPWDMIKLNDGKLGLLVEQAPLFISHLTQAMQFQALRLGLGCSEMAKVPLIKLTRPCLLDSAILVRINPTSRAVFLTLNNVHRHRPVLRKRG